MAKPTEISNLSFPFIAQDIFTTALSDIRRWKYPISNSIDPNIVLISHRSCFALAILKDADDDSPYDFTICLSTLVIDTFPGEKMNTAIYNYIMHELCHTIEGCFNHGKKCKQQVLSLNSQHGTKINPHPYSRKDTDLF